MNNQTEGDIRVITLNKITISVDEIIRAADISSLTTESQPIDDRKVEQILRKWSKGQALKQISEATGLSIGITKEALERMQKFIVKKCGN